MLALVALAATGGWFAGDQNGVNKTLATANARVAKVTEDALKEFEAQTEKHNREVSQYVQLQQSESERAGELESRLEDIQSAGDCGGTPAIIGLLSEAVNSEALPKNADQPFAVGSTDTIEGHHLYCITEYNRVAGQLDALITVLE